MFKRPIDEDEYETHSKYRDVAIKNLDLVDFISTNRI